MSIYEMSIKNPKKIAEFYKQLCEQKDIEIKQLKEQLNKYTDPKDLTLMFMYCDEKAKDKIKCLEQENKKYKEVINKLSKSIDGHYDGFTTINEFGACNDIIELLLEIKDILKEVE